MKVLTENNKTNASSHSINYHSGNSINNRADSVKSSSENNIDTDTNSVLVDSTVKTEHDTHTFQKTDISSEVCPLLSTSNMSYVLSGHSSLTDNKAYYIDQSYLSDLTPKQLNKKSRAFGNLYKPQEVNTQKSNNFFDVIGHKQPTVTDFMASSFFVAGILFMFYLLHLA